MSVLKGKKIFIKGIRNIVQACFLVLTLEIGLQFFIFVLQASSEGDISVSRPPGVEAFLPIGALMGWKRFIIEGEWDVTHPAAMVILGFAVFISLFLRKSFCGWVCPVGTVSEWIWKAGHIIFKKNLRLPVKVDYALRSLKYILLGFFLFIIFSMSPADIDGFLNSPYYKMSDVRMLFFFTRMSTITLLVLIFLVSASLIIKNFWCRYLCPYGGLLGIIALMSPSKIKRDPGKCINCKRCKEVCPYDLPVDGKQKIYSPECNGCMECVNACPVEDTLHMKSFGRIITPSVMALTISLIFIVTILSARITDHWDGNMQEHEFRTRLRSIETSAYTHPGLKK